MKKSLQNSATLNPRASERSSIAQSQYLSVRQCRKCSRSVPHASCPPPRTDTDASRRTCIVQPESWDENHGAGKGAVIAERDKKGSARKHLKGAHLAIAGDKTYP